MGPALGLRQTKRDLLRLQRTRKRVLWLAFAALVPLASVFASAWPAGSWQRGSLYAAGLTLILACVAGRVWCSLYISGRKIDELVTRGPYSVVRNPLYLFSAAGAAGVGAVFGSLVAALAGVAACMAVFSRVVRREERGLAEVRGAAYADYLARVPRFLPKLSLWRNSEELTIHTRLVGRTLVDALWFLAVVPWQWAIQLLQAAGILPVLFTLP